MDDVNQLKGRMAEALVEGIFKRAQYMVACGWRGETQVSALMVPARACPTSWCGRPSTSELGHRSYLLLAIEVKYCPNLDDYLRRDMPARSPRWRCSGRSSTRSW